MDIWTNFGSLEELMDQFPTEESCIPALFALKWPHGFRCPNCRHVRAYVIRTRRLPLYECSACRHQTSLTAGTILEGSRTSLRKWIAAIWLVSNPKVGINAVRLRSIINVTYKTAWAMLHKIRTAISWPMKKSDSNIACMALLPLTFTERSLQLLNLAKLDESGGRISVGEAYSSFFPQLFDLISRR